MKDTRHARRRTVFFCALLAAVLLFSSCSKELEPDAGKLSKIVLDGAEGTVTGASPETRAVFIASVYNINYPSKPDLSEGELKSEAQAVVDGALRLGMNTVYLQVHPACDALYKSKVFPVSKYLSSDGTLTLDVLEYFASLCRESGLSLYAWMNPLRVTVNPADTKEQAIGTLAATSPARDASLVSFYGDGKLYFDCGAPEVRNLIADEVRYLAENYDIDGIVFDDYFYPYPAANAVFDDKATFAETGGNDSLSDWRRENVNKLVRACHDAAADAGKRFGVSPFGIWQNDDGTNGGSPTAGLEAYDEIYCDSVTWIKNGWVDFISPQLYWERSSAAAPFVPLAKWWSDVCDGTDVEFIPALAAYRYDPSDTYESGELSAEIDAGRGLPSYSGYAMYGYAALDGNVGGAGNEAVLKASPYVFFYSPEKEPDGDISEYKAYVVFSGKVTEGTLSVNGVTIPAADDGTFECRLELPENENRFTVSCGDDSASVIVIK